MEFSFHRLTVIDEQGIVAAHITNSRDVVLNSKFCMMCRHHRISHRIKSDIAIFPSPQSEGVHIKVLGLPPQTSSKMVQHKLHRPTPLEPIMTKNTDPLSRVEY